MTRACADTLRQSASTILTLIRRLREAPILSLPRVSTLG
jgi:hypothetical protein